MRALALFAIFTAFSGCIERLHDYATLWGCKHAPTCDVYYLELSQVVGGWEFKEHSLSISRSLAVHRLVLPGPPLEVATYDSKQLKLIAMSADGRTAPTPLMSGSVKIDVPRRSAVVELTTRSGPFSGNGFYPLSTIGF